MAERSGASYRVTANRAAQQDPHQVTRATAMYAQMGDPAAQAVVSRGKVTTTINPVNDGCPQCGSDVEGRYCTNPDCAVSS